MKRRNNNTFQTPLVLSLNEIGFPPIPKTSDKAEQLLQELWTIGSCWHSPGPWWGGYSPEKYLNRWAHIFSARDDLSFDVIGWAFFAAKCEVEHKKQKKLKAYDFLAAQKPRVALAPNEMGRSTAPIPSCRPPIDLLQTRLASRTRTNSFKCGIAEAPVEAFCCRTN